MHIVMVHGYFLKGTGSNLFVKNLCCELCKLGHRVSLFCQETDVSDLDFIENAFDFDKDNKIYELFHTKETQYEGKCTLFRPNLNGFLPVFVYDAYEGYKVKEFISCKQEELEIYIQHNTNAINAALGGTSPDLVWTNHTIMQPNYVSRSNLAKSRCLHVMTVHGSCLNFAVRKSPLLTKYGLESVEKADKIAFVSEYSKNEFLEYFKYNNEIEKKSMVIPAGVDLGNFSPLAENESKIKYIEKLIQTLKKQISTQAENENSWKTDKDIVDKLGKIDFENEKIILYYGKYLWTKGVQLIIEAAPLVLQVHPDARFILVGYGSSRTYFEALIEALDTGKKHEYLTLLKHPETFDASIDASITQYHSVLIKRLQDSRFADKYFAGAFNNIRSKVVLTGFLSHEQLKVLIACSDITVAPSIFSEAFGLVAVEALSAGIIPMQTNHSGFTEVIKKYVYEFSDVFDKTQLNPLFLNENLVLNMANNMNVLLSYYRRMNQKDRQSIRQRARKVSEINYSWRSIAEQYLKLIPDGA